MSVKFSVALGGAERLMRELQLAKPRTRANVQRVIQANTKAVAAKAKAEAPKLTGEMAGTIRDEYSQDGLIGYVKVGYGKLPRRSRAGSAAGRSRLRARKRKTGLGAYAPVIDRGDPRRHIKAARFLSQPFAQQKPTAMKDIAHALNGSVQEIG